MKRLSGVTLMLLMMVACSGYQPTREISQLSATPIVVTVEVTRQVQVTPVLQPTPTPVQIVVTRLVQVPSPTLTTAPTTSNCYTNAFNQWAMNKCSAERRDDASQRMKDSVAQILKLYRDKPQDAQEFSRLQNEWENWAVRECDFRWTRLVTDTNGMLYYENGSWAPMQGNECLVRKYEDRIQELDMYLFAHR